MKNIKVSVILPCYNVADYIEPMFNSLYKQTFKDIEIICIDDKSTDDTVKKISKAAKKDKRIVLYKLKKNMGVGHARNVGLKKATGEYVCFFDPDDYIDTDFIEKLYTTAKKLKSKVVKAGSKTNNSESTVNELIKGNHFYFNKAHFSGLYNRKFLLDNDITYPEDVPTGQDAVFLSNIVLHVKNIPVINNTFYHYVTRKGSLDSAVLSHDKFLSRIKMLNYKIQMMSQHRFNTKHNKDIFIQQQILEHFFYNFKKISIQDKQIAATWLIDNKETLGIDNISLYCKPYQIKAIKNNNPKKFITNKIFYKEKIKDGYRNIYFCGIKIFSYKKF